MATTPKPTTITDAEKAIRSIAQEYVTHFNARATDKLVALFAPDGRMLPPFRPMAEGHSNMQQTIELEYKEYDARDLNVETLGVEISGDLAASFGTYSMSVQMPTGTRINEIGKWTAFLRHIGDTWKITNHCWNSDLPLTALLNLPT